jgi:hypothetical protein
MPVEARERPGGIFLVRITNRLQYAEFASIQDSVRELIQKLGKIKLLVVLDEFEGWERSDNWGDLSFEEQWDARIEKMAIVGEASRKDEVLIFVGKPFRPVVVEYFETVTAALAWLA